MFSILRKNDPYLYVLYLIAIIATRTAFLLLSDSAAIIEIDKAYLFSAIGLDQLPEVLSVIISALMVLVNAVLINQLVLNNNALSENNYLSGAIYIIYMSSQAQMFYLSGALLGVTFILISLMLILSHVKQRASEENIFFTGIFSGLAVIFYKPLGLFYICLLLIYFLYTRTIPRRYILMSFGFCFPFIITYVISIYSDELFSFKLLFFDFQVTEFFASFQSLNYQFLLAPLALGVYEMITSFSGKKMTNHQLHFQRIMMLILLFSLISALLWNDLGYTVILLIIPLTYFSAKLVLETPKKWVREVVSLIIISQLIWPYLGTANF